jgi:hypothetical protein
MTIYVRDKADGKDMNVASVSPTCVIEWRAAALTRMGKTGDDILAAGRRS